MNRLLLCIGVVLMVSTAPAAGESNPIVRTFPGASKIAVVGEGALEPRSVGSYSIRIYDASDPRFPYDHFITGTVRPRDGVVEDVRFSDLDGDGLPDIIVIIRSVGTGGYISADAFKLRGTVLTPLESLSGLANDADPILALEAKLRARAGKRLP